MHLGHLQLPLHRADIYNILAMVRPKIKLTVDLQQSTATSLPLRAIDTSSTQSTGIPLADKLDRILAAVEHTRENLEAKIDMVTVNLSLLRDDHKKLASRVSTTEQSLWDLQPKVKETQTRRHELMDRVRYLEGRAEDAEGRAHRSNLCIVGLPEGTEGVDPITWFEAWIKTVIPPQLLTPFFLVE